MVWTCGDSGRNPSKYHRQSKFEVERSRGMKDHEEGSKRVVGRCKEMDRAELEIGVERARGSCGLEKASQS